MSNSSHSNEGALVSAPVLDRTSEGFRADVLQNIQNEINRLLSVYGEHSVIDALRAQRDRLLNGGEIADPGTYFARLPYDDYLESEYWEDLRTIALDRADYRCQICNERGGLEVHHRSYERRGREGELNDLIVLCHHCHTTAHGRAA